jgi:hypothetical protein
MLANLKYTRIRLSTFMLVSLNLSILLYIVINGVAYWRSHRQLWRIETELAKTQPMPTLVLQPPARGGKGLWGPTPAGGFGPAAGEARTALIRFLDNWSPAQNGAPTMPYSTMPQLLVKVIGRKLSADALMLRLCPQLSYVFCKNGYVLSSSFAHF